MNERDYKHTTEADINVQCTLIMITYIKVSLEAFF